MAKTTTALPRKTVRTKWTVKDGKALPPESQATTGTGRGGARAGAGRKGGQPLPERWRARIRESGILERMVRSMALLNKVLPDLTRQELVGENGGPLEIITRAE